MNRRTFLQTAAVSVGAAEVLAANAASEEPARKSTPTTPFRIKPFEWDEAGVAELQAAMSSGKTSAVGLTRAFLQRIKDLDRTGPSLNSIIETNPDALAIADALDKERKTSGPRGPLHGIPIVIKDNLDTHDRMMTTAGSLALLGSIPAQDSFVVQKLRAAGAVIIAKSNLSEWANFRSNRSMSGWSGRGGQTKNPYVLDRNPSGSSSGSAVAVSANLCSAAIGTETDGSIVSPSSYSGIVGLKPTIGLVSRAGIIPIAQSQDTAGPMARTVTDVAILLSAMAGVDPRDPITQSGSGKAHPDYTTFLDPNGLRGARIGLARKFFRLRPSAEKLIENAIDEMKRHGATIIDPADLPSHGKFGDSEYEVMLYEFKAGMNAYLASLDPKFPREASRI